LVDDRAGRHIGRRPTAEDVRRFEVGPLLSVGLDAVGSQEAPALATLADPSQRTVSALAK